MGVDIQGKLRLALGSVKDHASIGKAMIYNHVHEGKGFSDIEIAVLRATGHDNGPIEDKYMHEILFLVSNSPGSIPFLAERISRRLCKTRDRLVALKTLSLIHRLLRGGNRYFEQELRSAHVSGHLQMSTSCFLRKNSSDFSSFSFLHSYAAYLEERVGWAINQAGKLEPVMFNGMEFRCYQEKSVDLVFRRLPKCQAFIDRVLDCSPRHLLPADNLAQAAMGNTLKESFQVYLMFCEGIEILVNMFFELTTAARSLACEILKRASRQSIELHDLYENCKRIIENKNLEYPNVQIITMDHVLALEQCSSFMSKTPSPSPSIMSKESEKEDKIADISFSSNPFSCSLETKISKVWVVFEEDYGDLKTPMDIV
ncbi:ENTH/VHS/GAT family protein [Corchorus olitorius]|uniref:ENTH/VHS/GAT family protein n=1 Tax=Corchorus olitorius TaxID=93759 RepID=A0A1R3I4L7_9ROSI|nr:ENTH/VHS/GAT family protein [Corchorus olitorius]